jgi:uncharacterized protein YjbI with pentapeptide repeats
VAERLGLSKQATRRLGLVVAIAAVAGVLWLVVVMAPPWFVDDQSLEGQKAQNEVRTTLLQGIAGLVLLVGVYFTWRQLHTAREEQITERYTRAIDQLGKPELDVRLGGIYALERIARDSPTDRRTIAEVLSAFVRTHAPWAPRLPGQYRATASIDQVPSLDARAPEVQAALTVLGRGEFTPPLEGDRPLNLRSVDLRHTNLNRANLHEAVLNRANLQETDLRFANLQKANLGSANLQHAYLSRANLQKANLAGANLQKATLSTANLQKANLNGANLQKASLRDVNLQEAFLDFANLQKADLRFANLQKASLLDANLQETDLRDVNLQAAASISTANLQGARATASTRWPDGFDWRAAGVIREDDEADQP